MLARQKRAISVLNALGFVEKPTLICLDKQFDYLERKLAGLADLENAATIVKECASIIYRFRSGLWSFICEVFKTPSGSAVSSGTGGMTSTEAESMQAKAWSILSTSTQLMQTHASPPTPLVLRQLNDTFRQLNSLKKCPNAATLNTNIEQLKDAFCDKFRAQIVLAFVTQVCEASRDQLMQEYFDPIVMSLPSFATESAIDLSVGSDDLRVPLSPFMTSDVSGLPLTKVGQLVAEASRVFDEIRNTSMVSSESKIELNRASVLTCCAADVMHAWEAVWTQIGPALLDMLDSGDVPGSSADTFAFRSAVTQAFKRHLHDMLALFLEKLLRSFVTEISPPTTMASIAGSTKNRSGGAEACVLFAVVSNCIELREKCIKHIGTWLAELYADIPSNGKRGHADDLQQLVLETESKCVEMYVSMHTGPLLQVLKSGAAEVAPQTRASSSSLSRTASRTDSRTSSFIGSDAALSPLSAPSTPTSASLHATASASSSSIPNDGRQYVFNVLLQLITLRSEIETSLASYAQCPEYVRAVTFQLTSVLGRFLADSVRELEASSEPSEWHRIHVRSTHCVYRMHMHTHKCKSSRVATAVLLSMATAPRRDAVLPRWSEQRHVGGDKDPAHCAREDTAASAHERARRVGPRRAAEPDEAPEQAVLAGTRVELKATNVRVVEVNFLRELSFYSLFLRVEDLLYCSHSYKIALQSFQCADSSVC